MQRIILDGTNFTTKETAHAILKEKLQLPVYYGNNLDALWDALTTDFTDRMIVIQNPQLITQQLGRYGKNLLRVIRKTRAHNRHFHFVYAYSL